MHVNLSVWRLIAVMQNDLTVRGIRGRRLRNITLPITVADQMASLPHIPFKSQTDALAAVYDVFIISARTLVSEVIALRNTTGTLSCVFAYALRLSVSIVVLSTKHECAQHSEAK